MASNFVGPDFILKGYLARQELNQRAQQLADEHKNAQDLLQFHYKALDQTAKEHKETIDLERGKAKENAGRFYNSIMGNLQSIPQDTPVQNLPQPTSGGQYQPGVNEALPTTTPGQPWMFKSPLVSEIAPEGIPIYPTYQSMLQKAGMAQEDIKAYGAGREAEAKLPSEISLKQHENELQQQLEAIKAAYGVNLQNVKDIASGQRTRDTIAGRLEGDRIQASARMRAAQIGKETNPDDVQNEFYAITHGLTDKVTPKSAPAVDGMYRDTGYKPFTIKDADNLNSYHTLNGLFDDMRKAISQIPDSYQGSVKSFLASKNPLAIGLTNDLKNIEARSPVAARELFGIDKGRLTNMEVSAAKQALLPGGIDKTGGLSNVGRLQRDRNNKIWNEDLGGMPLEQKANILVRNGFAGQFKTSILDDKGNRYEGNVEDLPDLEPGNFVLMQNPKTKAKEYIPAKNVKTALDDKGFKLAYEN